MCSPYGHLSIGERETIPVLSTQGLKTRAGAVRPFALDDLPRTAAQCSARRNDATDLTDRRPV